MNCSNCDATNLANAKYCSSCGHELPKPIVPTVDYQPSLYPPKPPANKKKIVVIIAAVAGFLIAYAIGHFAVQEIIKKITGFDKQMTVMASEMNKRCPMMADEYTRLDNVVALPDNVFQYNYTLVNIQKSEVNIDTVKKYIEPRIINNVKTNPDLQSIRDHKVTMSYNYVDKNGVFVLKIAVTPDMYQ